ncbi:MAG: hypothetical protein ACOX63_09335 [Christensenellales bacterium]
MLTKKKQKLKTIKNTEKTTSSSAHVVSVVSVNLQDGGNDDAQCAFARYPAAAQGRKPVDNTANCTLSIIFPVHGDILHDPVDIFLKQVKVTQRIALSFLTRAKAFSCVYRAGVVSAASSAPSSFISPGEGVLPP